MKIPIADVVVVQGGKVLLVQQRKQSAYGLWSFPGGHVEDDETIEEAAAREVQEELGVTLTHCRPFNVYGLNTAEGEIELHTFTGEIKGKIMLNNTELLDYGWFDLPALEKMKTTLRAPLILQIAQQALRS